MLHSISMKFYIYIYDKYNFNYKYLVNYEKNLQFDIETNTGF